MSDKVRVGVDLGGTNIKIGLVRGAEILTHRVIDAQSRGGLGGRLEDIAGVVEELAAETSLAVGDLAGVGIGFPCLIDFANCRVSSTIDKYPDATSLDIRAWWRDRFDLDVAIDNDANCYLLGEMVAGAGQGYPSAILLMLGTGIGASAFGNGAIFHGQHGQGGCLGGHITVNIHGRKCVCGNIGCAEAEASSWALPLKFNETPGHEKSSLNRFEKLSYKDVFEESRRGDAVALELIDHSIRTWGAAAVSLIHMFDPDIVIVGGGIAKQGAPLLDPLQEYINTHAWSACGYPKVIQATRPDTAALIGAAHLTEMK